MNRIRLLTATLFLATTTLAQQPAPIETGWDGSVPLLRAQSTWRQDVARGDATARRGVFPVGNGRVFTHMGLGDSANTMGAITGPRYQTSEAWAPDGQFGSLTLELHGASGPVELPTQRVRRTRVANFVITEDRSDTLALRTVTFAPDGLELLRWIEVEAFAASPALSLRVRAPNFAAEDGALLAEHGRGRRAAHARLVLHAGEIDSRGAFTQIPALEAGDRWHGALSVRTATDQAGLAARDSDPADLLARARAFATAATRTTRAVEYDTDHVRLRDLLADWRINLDVLRCAESGLIVPMVHRRSVSIRDNAGAMLAMLRYGMHAEAKATLEYLEAATRLLGEVPREVPLDLDVSTAPARDTVDWRTMRVPAAELPSWVILQHYWYWRATRDTELIDAHWPLLDVCLKRQRRTSEDLMPFEGSEPYLDALAAVPDLPEDTGLVPPASTLRPAAHSLASSTMMMLATQAMGDLVTARIRLRGGDTPATNPYQQRMFKMMQQIESHYWLEDAHRFAPAISTVSDSPWREVIANANLMPLWIGWTFPTGEKSRENLRSTLSRLWREGARIGTTPTVGHTTGDLQGMLLVALTERNGTRRMDALDALLELAEPAGEWAELYDPSGRPCARRDAGRPNRMRPGESGLNLDAILYATTGIRQACMPSWDMRDIRMKLRLPNGATQFSMRGHQKDGRRLAVRFERQTHMMTEAEIEENRGLDPDKQRDPNVPHSRIHFVAELLEGTPEQGYYDVAIDVGGTMFVRYLSHDVTDEHDFRRIDERIFFESDTEQFLPGGEFETPRTSGATRTPAANATVLLVTNRTRAVEMLGPLRSRTTVLDSSQPYAVEELRPLLLTKDGELAHERLLLDWGHDKAPAAAWARSPAWRSALQSFESAGGLVIQPRFLGGGRGGRLRLGPDVRSIPLRFTAESPCRAVLRVGADRALTLRLDGEEIGQHERGGAAPDGSAILVELARGAHTIEVVPTDPGPGTAFVRLTDPRGFPIAGID